jgi:hypothetical protein
LLLEQEIKNYFTAGHYGIFVNQNITFLNNFAVFEAG